MHSIVLQSNGRSVLLARMLLVSDCNACRWLQARPTSERLGGTAWRKTKPEA